MFKDMRKNQGLGSEYVFTYAKSEDKLKGKKPVRKRIKLAPVLNVSETSKVRLKRL